MYTAQSNKNGNVIVCKDETPRQSYEIIHTGTYQQCLEIKVRYMAHIESAKALIAMHFGSYDNV